MIKKTLLFVCLFFSFILFSIRVEACEAGHQIDENINGGKIIKLENGSFWGIDNTDISTTALWKRRDNITVCDYRLVNTSENQSVAATPLHLH